MDIDSVGAASIQRAVEKRMRTVGASSLADYVALLSSNSMEIQGLVECVVVPETWFFRGRETFAALVEIARHHRAQLGAHRAVRILSVPSSTGEEPYSIVMALVDAGFAMSEFSVEAVDVSVSALEKAGVARYGANSFRGDDLAFRERHFTKSDRGWQLSRSIMDGVRFRRRNVTAPDFLSDCAPFHIVFCRNLLIYLETETQSALVDRLTELMVPEGHLFLGSGEAIAISGKPYSNAGYAMAFAYRRAPQAGGAKWKQGEERPSNKMTGSRRQGAPVRKSVLAPSPAKPAKTAAVFKASSKVSLAAVSEEPGKSLLIQARELADAGRLEDAAALCERLLLSASATAEVLYLLGVVRDAQGNFALAAECYRKAIYLDPTHTDAMLHLALVRERQGEPGVAANLRARARRVDLGGDIRP